MTLRLKDGTLGAIFTDLAYGVIRAAEDDETGLFTAVGVQVYINIPDGGEPHVTAGGKYLPRRSFQ